MTIHAIPGHFPLPRPKTNQKPARFSSVRVGRNSIRPIDGHVDGRMKLIPIQFLIHRIKTNRNPVHFPVHLAICMTICGAYSIRPYTGTQKNGDYSIPRIKTNQNPDEFLPVRVGAYCIRPTNGHARGRINPIPIQFLIHRIKTNQTAVHFPVHLAICMVVCGAYSTRPYTDDKNLVHFPVRSTICMVICGAYSIRPYTGTRKNGDSFIPRIKMNLKPAGFSILRIKRSPIPTRFSNPGPKMNLKPAGFSNPGQKGIAVPDA